LKWWWWCDGKLVWST